MNTISAILNNKKTPNFGAIINGSLYFKDINDPCVQYALIYFLDVRWIRSIKNSDDIPFDYIATDVFPDNLKLFFTTQ